MKTNILMRDFSCLVVYIIILQLLGLAAATEDFTRRRLHKGWVTGNRHSVLDNVIVHEYLGIPMAKPPIGEKRFKRPEPVDAWPGQYNASKRANACLNVKDTVFGKFYGSDIWNPEQERGEDCLYINVWIPNPGEMSHKKAIMVWIYGGGYYSGSSSLDIYDGRYLAASQNVIVVSMQYRLGILGFLNLETEDAPGNMGLLDQMMGLQWTQDNAEYLYGDRNNVTIMGESAGSVSVSLHLISPLSRNLFARAIMQSGASVANWAMMTTESSWYRLNKTIYGNDINCPEPTTHVPTLMKCLLSVPADILFDGTWAPSGIAQFSWLPSVDHHFLIEEPKMSLSTGNFKRCPILIGTNSNEGSVFLVYELIYNDFGSNFKNGEINFTLDHSKFETYMNHVFHFYPQWPQRMNSFGKEAITFRYTDWRNKDDTLLNRRNMDQAVGDFHFLCPTNAFSQYFVKVGMPVYYYHFTHRSTRSPWGNWMGVMHGDEIFFSFGLPIRPDSLYTDDEKLLSLHMMQLWSNFSKTGDPNGEKSGESWVWPAATQYGKEYYELSIASMKTPIVGSGPRTEYCAFWDEYLPRLVTGTADIEEVEKEWKNQFAEWNNQYIVNWKHEYKKYLQTIYEQETCAEKNSRGKRDSSQEL